MFKVTFLVEDDQLGAVKRSLIGKVHDLTDIPVVNAELQDGKVVAQTSGTIIDKFIHYVSHIPPATKLKRSDVINWLLSEGHKVSSGNVARCLKRAIDGRLLKVKGSRGGRFYIVQER